LSIEQALLCPDGVAAIKLVWHTQKNGEHGEAKLFTCNPRKEGHSFVAPMLRIIQHFVELQGLDLSTPLAIFRNAKHVTQYITETEIKLMMRATAVAIYDGLDPKKHASELKLWSAHSY